MENLAFATVAQLRSKLDKKEISVAELTGYFIERFKKYDGQVGSALEVFDQASVLAQFNNKTTPLAGIPGILKDNICQEGRRATCGSKILQNYTASYDATAVARLKEQGALLLGRANMDEFAMGSSTETSAFQKTTNPWDATRVPGGSSGGSAAAVAAGLVPWALGSDTGGSVRQPAAFCGIVGLKPTYGLVSRYGLIAYGSSLDQIGVFSRSVTDSANILSALAGKDSRDSSTVQVAPRNYAAHLTGQLKPGLRIGVIENALTSEGMDPEIVAALEETIRVFEKAGATIERVALPSLEYSAACYFVISRAEAASNLARFDGVRYGMRDQDATKLRDMYFNTRHDGFGREVKTRIMVGNYVLSAGHAGKYYENAKRVQRMMSRDFSAMFRNVDLLIMPTHPVPAFTFGAFEVDKLQMDLQDYFTCSMNLAGIPALSLPCGMTKSKLPIGFQLIGPHLSEELIFQTAYAFEQNTPWHTMHPEGF